MVGVPGLNGSSEEAQELFQALTTLETVDNPAVRATILHKWESWVRAFWLFRSARFLLICVSYLALLIITPKGSPMHLIRTLAHGLL